MHIIIMIELFCDIIW